MDSVSFVLLTTNALCFHFLYSSLLPLGRITENRRISQNRPHGLSPGLGWAVATQRCAIAGERFPRASASGTKAGTKGSGRKGRGGGVASWGSWGFSLHLTQPFPRFQASRLPSLLLSSPHLAPPRPLAPSPPIHSFDLVCRSTL